MIKWYFSFFMLFTYQSYGAECSGYLADKSIEKRSVLKLKPEAQERRILKNKIRNSKVVNIEDIALWLDLNKVKFKTVDKIIEILPDQNTELGRFSGQLQKIVQRYISDGYAIESFKLVFDSTHLAELDANGFFSYNSKDDFGVSNNEKINQPPLFEIQIGLSLDSILNLKPGRTESHELVHWTSFFRRAKFLDSIVFGNVDAIEQKNALIDPNSFIVSSDSAVSFSLEEFKAHLVTLTKAYSKLKSTQDMDSINKLKSEIKMDIDLLRQYQKITHLALMHFSFNSLFRNVRKESFWSDFDKSLVLKKEDSLGFIHGSTEERITIITPFGAKPGNNLINYEIADLDSGIIYDTTLPVPRALQSQLNLGIGLDQADRDQLTVIFDLIKLKVNHVHELLEYITVLDLSRGISRSLNLFSPMYYFNSIEKRYLDAIKNF